MRTTALILFAAMATFAGGALAQSGAGAEPAASARDSLEVPAEASGIAERPFLFSTDPSLPAPGHVVVSVGLGNVTRTGEERPDGAGALLPTAGAELGLLPRLSFYAESGYLFWSQGSSNVSPLTLATGFRLLLTNPDEHRVLLTLVTSYGLDFFGNNQALLSAAFAYNSRLVRLVATGTASHTFQSDADALDVNASVGAVVPLPYGFRAGVEGVFTDLEELTSPQAEGGVSAFAGPTVGWEWGHRLQLVAGPAFGAGPNYSGVMARFAAAAQF